MRWGPLLVALLLAIITASPVAAHCVCRCVNGQMMALCTSTMDIAPMCPGICQPTPLGIEPPSYGLPPLGTTSCRQVQVYDPSVGRYNWKRVCL